MTSLSLAPVRFPTFEEYCLERWEFKRTYAHYLIEAAAVVHNCEQASLPPPQNEAQARELARRAAVSHDFVSRLRSQLSSNDSSPPRIGADGKTRKLPKEQGGTKPKRGRPKKGAASGGISTGDSRDAAARRTSPGRRRRASSTPSATRAPVRSLVDPHLRIDQTGGNRYHLRTPGHGEGNGGPASADGGEGKWMDKINRLADSSDWTGAGCKDSV